MVLLSPRFLTDAFTSAHLAAAKALLSGPTTAVCSVRKTPIDIRTAVRPSTSPNRCFLLGNVQDPVTVCLCPRAHAIRSLAHIACLSEHFYTRGPPRAAPLIARGSACPTCSTWVSWGDIVKGMYRRKAGRAVQVEDDDHELVEKPGARHSGRGAGPACCVCTVGQEGEADGSEWYSSNHRQTETQQVDKGPPKEAARCWPLQYRG